MRPVRVAALIVLAVIAAGSSGCGGEDASSPRPTTTAAPTTQPPVPTVPADTPVEGGPISLAALAPGSCLNDAPNSAQRNVTALLVSCDQAHRYEISDVFTFPPGDKVAPRQAAYPGETQVRTSAEQACYERFEAWMGTPWTASEFDIQVWWPSEQSWLTNGDRKVACGVYLFDGGRTVGSAKGTAR